MSAVPQRKPEAAAAADKPRSVKTSVLTGIGLAIVVVGSLAMGAPVFFALAFVALMIAQAELYTVLKADGYSPAIGLGLAAGAAVLLATFFQGSAALTVAVTASVAIVVGWAALRPVEEARSMLVSTVVGLLYGPFLACFLVLLLQGPDGAVLTGTVIGMVAVNDSGAYLLGRKLGRHPMAPSTSPKKSWEGFASGMAVVVLLSIAVLPFIHPFDVPRAFALAVVISLAGPLGDLTESLLKRDLDVKDMGSLVPGHGGLFDRIDAIIFVGPVAYVALRVLGLTD